MQQKCYHEALSCSHIVVEDDKAESMAQASQEQGAPGTADPEEDSPNMIVYRKSFNLSIDSEAEKSVLDENYLYVIDERRGLHQLPGGFSSIFDSSSPAVLI
ncbi:hypothetical protein AMELA_G00281490 [Ameiurus melas]|uniref:Uncharacterized protein n=1 Tax=Ameiurus melas TaxID=219545 RepID=A0A7J5ZNF7_AMEME|nr:hypothetical protein AMELA_G00281490 [Ameiurus melas]